MSQILGRENRVVRRELDDDTVSERLRRIANAFDRKRAVEAEFTSFRKWAEPRIRKAIDPDYEHPDVEGEAELSIEEAHGLRVELTLRRKLKTSTVAAIKAELEHLEHAAATRSEHRRIECELVADPDKLEVVYRSAETGEEVDRRGMTDAERQETLPNLDPPKGKKIKRNGAPEAVQ